MMMEKGLGIRHLINENDSNRDPYFRRFYPIKWIDSVLIPKDDSDVDINDCLNLAIDISRDTFSNEINRGRSLYEPAKMFQASTIPNPFEEAKRAGRSKILGTTGIKRSLTKPRNP
jgi:hypothetical protein